MRQRRSSSENRCWKPTARLLPTKNHMWCDAGSSKHWRFTSRIIDAQRRWRYAVMTEGNQFRPFLERKLKCWKFLHATVFENHRISLIIKKLHSECQKFNKNAKKGSFWRVFFNLNFYFRPFLSLVSVSLMLLKACCCNVRSDDDSVSPTIF